MSDWKGYEKPRYEAATDVGKSMDNEGPVDDGVLPRKDGTGLLPPLKEGSSNIPDTSWSHLLEKGAPPLCITDSNILAGHDSNINISFLGECENDTLRNTICSGYPFPGLRGAADQNKLSYVSSADACLAMLSKEQKDREHDLLSYDYPNVSDFEDFDRMFSSSGSHYTNVSPAIDSSISGNQMPLNTRCNSFPLRSDAERKGKSVLSELAYDDIWVAEKKSTLEQLCSGNEYRDPNMISTTLKDLTTSQGKEINPNLESIAYSSSGGCGFIQDFQDQELLASILSAQPCSLQAISKQNLSSDCFASNSLNSFSFQEQLSSILAVQQVPLVQSTLGKSGIESSAPSYGSSLNPSVQNTRSMEMLPDPFSIQPAMPFGKSEIIYASQLLPARLVVDKHLEQHNVASDSLGQGKINFQNEGGQNKELPFTNLNLPSISILSSTSHENSCMSPTFSDDMFMKAASFQQFQMIVEQKGTRTKLCVRDSLYRLARSAEQRHHCGIAGNGRSDSRLMHPGANDLNRHPEFIGMSNDLNAIDRSVAYLLYHESIGSGSGSADDAKWLIPSRHIHGFGGKFSQV